MALLYDDEGNLRSFREFRKLALQVSKDYNVNWLQTEYNTAVRAARSAVNYRKALETKHLYPNLEYIESTASVQREEHLEYVGTILPIEHPWWDTHMPPSAWNCACSVRPTNKDVTEVPPADLVNPVFKNNPGKTAQMINTKEHPYIKGVCPYFDKCKRRTSGGNFKSLLQLSDEENPPVIPQCGICKMAADAEERARKKRRKLKDKEIREWAKESIPEYGLRIEADNFVSGEIHVNRRSVNDIASHFTENHLKDLSKDIHVIIKKAQFLTEAGLNPERHNYINKVNRGVTGYRYYKLFHNGLNLRLNVEIRNGKEHVYMLNIIVK